MRKEYTLSLAVVGVAACVAVFALNTQPSSQTLFGSTADDVQYYKYVQKYGKSYGTKEEFRFRQEKFANSLETINSHNAQNAVSFHLSANKFADWTPEEYKRLLGFKSAGKKLSSSAVELPTAEIPASVNWYTTANPSGKVVVNGPKDQGQCGSCWAFSAVAAMESSHALKSGNLVSMSEQQLVDCANAAVDSKYTSEGCNGGEMDDGFLYAETNAMNTESQYPYKGVDGTCAPKTGGVFNTFAYVDVPQNNDSQFMAALARGPLSIAIEADTMVFQFYSGGIMNSKSCGQNLDHGVTAVGYGTDGTQDYVLVKNSWGASWGLNGFIKIARTANDTTGGICGMQMEASYPNAKN
jgi:KDEL-tailed cysteine endopeptidase